MLVNPPAVPNASARVGDGSFLSWQKGHLTADQYRSLPMEHLGIMSIKAHAASKGMTVETVNGLVSKHRSVDGTWAELASVARRSGPPTLIGFSNIATLHEVVALAERSRREWPEAKLALGNTFASLNYERLLREHDCFDFAFVGEGEVGFTQLGEALLNDRPADAVPGLAWRADDGEVRSTAPTTVDLDSLPWPARDELPAVLREGFAAAAFASRGCPYRCTFCGTGALSSRLGRGGYRDKSVGNLVDELEYLKTDFGIGFVTLTDDLFLTKHPRSQERAAAFADELIRRRLGLALMLDARVDSIADVQLMAHLRRAGLCRIFVGVESGSHGQLVSYRKRHAPPGAVTARICAVQDLGIEVIPGLITFHPAVGPAELRETVQLLEATGYRAPRTLLNRITAYAGTQLHGEYAAKGYLTEDWPVGEWDFVDPCAGETYRRLRDHLDEHPRSSFEETRDFLLTTLDEWEAQAGDRALVPGEVSA